MAEQAPKKQDEFDKVRLITRKELQQLMPLSGMTISRMEKNGVLPKHILIGRKAFWRQADILEFLDNIANAGDT
ncbi:hypothetical protein JQ597_32650 [Bradyrhizobium sp. AUGA SZCCT0177]|uniref:helix-turn-helix transcriptional regulator n=1 Tax=Bradyrhizobium sp. AUGA SZCCT0177 TaxID=2807665 RepID=UPI001BA71D5A|nr:hypothetical protein [Bradyrhizobium sp. AUGA SZCCT0177]MBR1286816.1 hypothetical protein [Bradyrhizobium sp. AUGA SZCCT0177]